MADFHEKKGRADRMINFFIVVVILLCFSFWEIELLLAYLVLPRQRAMKLANRFAARAIHLIFSMFYAYRNFKIHLEKKNSAPLPERFLVVANHQSLLDIVVVMKILPKGLNARFVAKHELAWDIPLISLLLRTTGHCLVRRQHDALNAMRAVARMAKRSKRDGTIPVIFPEGTRSRTGELGTFHSAGYRKLLETDSLPILVIAVDGGYKVAKLEDFIRDFGTLPYKVSILGVLPAPAGKKEALESLEKARSMIADELIEMQKSP